MKKVYSLFALCFTLLCVNAQVTVTFTGNTTWTIPVGVTSVTIRAYGGGGGTGGQDCGAGCGFPAAGPVGLVVATYTVVPGNTIGIYPGGKGGNGASAVTSSGGGTAGVNTFNTAFNGGTGGNTGNTGTSGGGGGGGAASLVVVNGALRIVAGGGGGGGGMANSANSGQPGVAGTLANGTSTTGGNGLQPTGDGGGSGAGGGGQFGSQAGTLYPIGTEQAGNGGYRGNNSVTGATSTTSNTSIAWTNAGQVEITYTPVAGTAAPSQTICSGTQPANITLTGYAGTVQWQVMSIGWADIAGATGPTLTGAQIGSLIATNMYRAVVSGSAISNTVTITVAPNAPGAAVAPSGTGTVGDPYLISTIQNLRWVSETSSSWNKVFRQTASIDAAGFNQSCYNSGTGWNPIGNATTAFTGTWDGGGFTTSNLFINRPGAANLGFFGISSGTIQNLNLTAASISTSSPVANTFMGILAGQNNGTITGCTVSGTVSGGTNYIGGLVGSSGGTILNSSAAATVSGTAYLGGLAGRVTGGSIDRSFSTGAVNGGTYAGGITGEISAGAINNSYSWANVTGTNRVGGAIGSKTGASTVANIYSTGTVPNVTNAGGLIGELVSGSSNATNSFWDTQTSGRATSAGGATGKTTAEMKAWDTYYSAGWDLQCESGNGTSNFWGINSSSNNGYPFVSWQPFTTTCPTWNGTTSNDFNNPANWSGGFVPSAGMDIVFSPTAPNDLILSQNYTAGNINFNGSGRKLVIGSNNLTINGTVTGASATSYIQTNGTGVVRKSIASGASFTFPIGNSTYNPATITNNNAAADVFSAGVVDEVYTNGGSTGGTISGARVRKTWNIAKQNANSSPGYDLVLNWNAGDVSAPIAAPALISYNGTQWSPPGTGSTTSTSTSLTYTGFTPGFIPFAIVDNAVVVPVIWGSFTVRKQAYSSVLDWSTETEENSDVYEIETSVDGNNWKKIGTVKASGNSQLTKHYNFVHGSPVAGVNLYRLLQRDRDGRFSYSKTVSIQFGDQVKKILLYPNPVSGTVVNVVLPESRVVRVMNSVGNVVIQRRLASGTTQLSVTSLAKGTYVLVADGEFVSFIVQ
ncbi:MAG: T9SS type A sorting domain-containing protein [Flavitalea sp.]